MKYVYVYERMVGRWRGELVVEQMWVEVWVGEVYCSGEGSGVSVSGSVG